MFSEPSNLLKYYTLAKEYPLFFNKHIWKFCPLISFVLNFIAFANCNVDAGPIGEKDCFQMIPFDDNSEYIVEL